MFCRCCGHDNGSQDRGPCANCGFKLEDQHLPLREQRASLEKPLPPREGEETRSSHLWVPRRSVAGHLAVLIFLVGAAIALFILTSFERAEYEPVVAEIASEVEVDQGPRDSLPILLDTDIVYEFNPEGTAAIPRTNVDLSLIPVGTRISYLGHYDLSIRPVVSYITQRMSGRDFRILEAHNLYCWTDTTETEFLSVPLIKPFIQADTTALEPVLMRFLFSEEWLRGEVQEFNIDIVEPSGGFRFSARPFENMFRQVNTRLARRDYGERPVHVVLIFPDNSTLGQLMEIAGEVRHYTDSLGYQGFLFRYAMIE